MPSPLPHWGFKHQIKNGEVALFYHLNTAQQDAQPRSASIDFLQVYM